VLDRNRLAAICGARESGSYSWNRADSRTVHPLFGLRERAPGIAGAAVVSSRQAGRDQVLDEIVPGGKPDPRDHAARVLPEVNVAQENGAAIEAGHGEVARPDRKIALARALSSELGRINAGEPDLGLDPLALPNPHADRDGVPIDDAKDGRQDRTVDWVRARPRTRAPAPSRRPRRKGTGRHSGRARSRTAAPARRGPPSQLRAAFDRGDQP
jgi:hypothetical protein